VTGARIGERWQVGSDGLVLEVSRPRGPCRTFASWLAIRGWVKTFTRGRNSRRRTSVVITPGNDCAVATRSSWSTGRITTSQLVSFSAR